MAPSVGYFSPQFIHQPFAGLLVMEPSSVIKYLIISEIFSKSNRFARCESMSPPSLTGCVYQCLASGSWWSRPIDAMQLVVPVSTCQINYVQELSCSQSSATRAKLKIDERTKWDKELLIVCTRIFVISIKMMISRWVLIESHHFLVASSWTLSLSLC